MGGGEAGFDTARARRCSGSGGQAYIGFVCFGVDAPLLGDTLAVPVWCVWRGTAHLLDNVWNCDESMWRNAPQKGTDGHSVLPHLNQMGTECSAGVVVRAGVAQGEGRRGCRVYCAVWESFGGRPSPPGYTHGICWAVLVEQLRPTPVLSFSGFCSAQGRAGERERPRSRELMACVVT